MLLEQLVLLVLFPPISLLAETHSHIVNMTKLQIFHTGVWGRDPSARRLLVCP